MAAGFSGGGVSIYLGTGYPNSIDAASQLAGDLGVTDETGNAFAGIEGFYQGATYRLGAAFQAHAWGGVNPGTQNVDDDAAGVAAAIGGLYATWTFRHDRLLLNAGGIVGAGRALIGYSLGDTLDTHESVTTFYLEPNISLGVAATSWFGVEFQLSVPIFLLTEDLVLVHDNAEYRVRNGDMAGVTFCMKLSFGKLANP